MHKKFNDYYVALEIVDPERKLYLAVPINAYQAFFQKPIIQKSFRRIGAEIIVYAPLNETIVLWTK